MTLNRFMWLIKFKNTLKQRKHVILSTSAQRTNRSVVECIYIIERTHSPALLIHSLLIFYILCPPTQSCTDAAVTFPLLCDHSDRGGKRKRAARITGRTHSHSKKLSRRVMQSTALSNLDKDNTLKEQRHKSKSWRVEGGNATRDVLLLPVAPASDEA